MSTSISVLRASEHAWDAWLELIERDFQHSAGYHRLAEQFGEGEAYLAVYGTRDRFLAWPYLLRPISDSSYRDVTSVYGYPGPLARACGDDPTFLEEAWLAIRDAWASQRAIAAFTRFNPLLNNHNLLPPDAVVGLVGTGATVSIDLRQPNDVRWGEYKRQLQQHIRRARGMGITTEFDREWKYLSVFEEIYSSTMQRNAADSSYFYKHDYFLRLKEELKESGLLAVSRLNSEIICASLIIECAGIVNTHLAGTVDRYLPLSPFKSLVEDLCGYEKERGNVVVHLGGGRGGQEDSLFRFKSEFSPRRHRFHVGRWVLNQGVYDELSRGLITDYFPAYRAPKQDAPESEKPRLLSLAGTLGR